MLEKRWRRRGGKDGGARVGSVAQHQPLARPRRQRRSPSRPPPQAPLWQFQNAGAWSTHGRQQEGNILNAWRQRVWHSCDPQRQLLALGVVDRTQPAFFRDAGQRHSTVPCSRRCSQCLPRLPGDQGGGPGRFGYQPTPSSVHAKSGNPQCSAHGRHSRPGPWAATGHRVETKTGGQNK